MFLPSACTATGCLSSSMGISLRVAAIRPGSTTRGRTAVHSQGVLLHLTWPCQLMPRHTHTHTHAWHVVLLGGMPRHHQHRAKCCVGITLCALSSTSLSCSDDSLVDGCNCNSQMSGLPSVVLARCLGWLAIADDGLCLSVCIPLCV
jgi:hypothetical protein